MNYSDNSQFVFNDNREALVKELHEKAIVALEAVGIHIEGEAKEELENTPRRIDTGLLRNSITHAISGQKPAISSYHASSGSNKVQKGKNAGRRRSATAKNAGSVGVGQYTSSAPDDPDDAKAVYIGTNVEYAIYVHEGTSRMTPNRFIKNACVKNEAQIKRYINKIMKSAGNIDGAFKGMKPTASFDE